ncbi:MAG TPA: hypothetical protein VLC73_18655 [Burkholderiales bacterium]|nr:hypothetical protein [Burkholderiales bacterium]
MINTMLVSLAVTAGVIALAGVPLRCWQFASGQFRSQIPPHALARATFRLFAFLILVPNALAWTYAVYILHRYYACVGTCAQEWASTAIAVGMLGSAYALFEGFLLTARYRPKPATGDQSRGTRSEFKR